jgi:hypothetical protein
MSLLSQVNELQYDGYKVDEDGNREITRRFLIYFPSATATQADALAALTVARGDAHPLDANCVAKTLDANPYPQSDSKGLFLAVVNYKSKLEQTKNDKEGSSPLAGDKTVAADSRPPKISYTSIRIEKQPGFYDYSTPQKKVCNSVGQPFTDLPNVTYYHMLITITGYKGVADLDLFDKRSDYLNTVNVATWNGYAAAVVKCNDFSGTTEYEQGEQFWNYKIELEVNLNGWNPTTIANRGTCFKLSNGLPPQPILDNTGKPIPPPGVFLDSNGIPLPLSEEPDTVNGGLIAFKFYNEVDWTNLLVQTI